jgi:hypothetical protein
LRPAAVLVLACIATLTVLAAGFVQAGTRALQQANRREFGGRKRFVAEYGGRGVPAEVLAQTYDTLSRRLPPKAGELRPDDRLGESLGMSAMDVEDVALLVAARCDGRIPTAHDLDELDREVRTVDDLVQFLAPFCRGGSAPRRVARR